MGLGRKTCVVVLVCGILFAILCASMLETKTFIPRLTNALPERPNAANMVSSKPSEKITQLGPSRYSDDSMRGRVHNQFRQCQSLKHNGSEFGKIRKYTLKHIVVNDKHEVLFCYLPKVACTNFKRMFLVLAGFENATDHLKYSSRYVHDSLSRKLPMLSSFSQEDVLYRLQNYKKVIFVRNPFVRLLSAFRSKLGPHGFLPAKRNYGTKIIKMFRENPTKESLRDIDVKFSEFVDYLLDPKVRQNGYDLHWNKYNSLCNPCHVRYNFIGKHETLDEDVDLMLKDIGADKLVKLPDRANTYKRNQSDELVEQFYKEISPEKIMKLYDIFRVDFDIFGYEVPDVIRRIINGSLTIT